MKTGIIVQARMSSSRLPGKVLRLMGGREMIGLLLDSLQQCGETDEIIVSTSLDPTDDCLAEFCRARGIEYFRGSLTDVAGRFVETAEKYKLDSFVRICGDSPLLDHRLVDRAVKLFYASPRTDLVSNIFPRSFPKGQSVEVVRTRTLVEALAGFDHPDHHEHVTRYFYEHPEEYEIVGFTAEEPGLGVPLTVDTEQDFTRLQRIVQVMDRPHWQYSWREKAALAIWGAAC